MTAKTESYPLSWPVGWERTKYQKQSAFKQTSFGRTRDDLFLELKRMGARNIVLSTNVPLRQDGLPYASYAALQDTGVAVYFTYKDKQMVFACDKWKRVEDNLHSIEKTISAIRGIERWGASEMLERAFTGFAQLQAPPTEDWWDVLEVQKDSGREFVKANFRKLAMKYHPDNGGSLDKMVKINNAYEKFCSERGL